MPVVLTVDTRSGVPIYQQIVEQVKRSTALGVLQSGEQLPTVKQLALDLTVNPNTVARAYRDLERDGVIETAPGRGSFVKSDGATAPARLAANDVTRAAVEGAVREAKAMGLTRNDLRAVIDTVLNRWFPEEK
ncbi:MAG TPA: GntR family transcriptional regulator [Candidatus Tyrphobacter sp.]